MLEIFATTSKLSLTVYPKFIFSGSVIISGLLIFMVELSRKSSYLVHADISRNFGMLYKKVKMIGMGNNKDLYLNFSFGWQQFKYLSTDILTVTATDPTLPM